MTQHSHPQTPAHRISWSKGIVFTWWFFPSSWIRWLFWIFAMNILFSRCCWRKFSDVSSNSVTPGFFTKTKMTLSYWPIPWQVFNYLSLDKMSQSVQAKYFSSTNWPATQLSSTFVIFHKFSIALLLCHSKGGLQNLKRHLHLRALWLEFALQCSTIPARWFRIKRSKWNICVCEQREFRQGWFAVSECVFVVKCVE